MAATHLGREPQLSMPQIVRTMKKKIPCTRTYQCQHVTPQGTISSLFSSRAQAVAARHPKQVTEAADLEVTVSSQSDGITVPVPLTPGLALTASTASHRM